MPAWTVLIFWIGLIYFFGTAKWGRAGTQALIDRCRSNPRVHGFLNRYHGRLRAAFHYFEFGGLTLIVYGLLGRQAGHPLFAWDGARAAITGTLAAAAAVLDEVHQLRSGGRCFRLVDYLHSCCGISLALLVIRYSSL